VPSSLGVASHRSVGTCTRLLVANPFLPLGLGIETSVQMGGLAACVLTHADKRHPHYAHSAPFGNISLTL